MEGIGDREALEIADRHQMARACTALVESGVLISWPNWTGWESDG